LWSGLYVFPIARRSLGCDTRDKQRMRLISLYIYISIYNVVAIWARFQCQFNTTFHRCHPSDRLGVLFDQTLRLVSRPVLVYITGPKTTQMIDPYSAVGMKKSERHHPIPRRTSSSRSLSDCDLVVDMNLVGANHSSSLAGVLKLPYLSRSSILLPASVPGLP